ncbi:unnamed protein product [Heligmosomoides polygyrus]|uniref:Secreted protein n=1 Tax=Heligmosomoides polygyrus TaxID=6339 RepID=A0A183GLF9_HELPZ|nr:unnamed protein product [Heligmosomoides polygyrus]
MCALLLSTSGANAAKLGEDEVLMVVVDAWRWLRRTEANKNEAELASQTGRSRPPSSSTLPLPSAMLCWRHDDDNDDDVFR